MKNKSSEQQFKSFNIPDKFFNKLFEFTGSGDTNKGYILAYVDQNGCPVILTNTASVIIEMGLRNALSKYLKESENDQESVDIQDDGI